jgi:hypothetical protein
MIIGAHSIIYSKAPQADRVFLQTVLELPSVDAGEGWLIFGLPPAEVAVHPSDKNDVHEFYLMCDDVEAFVEAMGQRNIRCSPVLNQGWGLITHVMLPGGGKVGVYQPRHARPKPMKARSAKRNAPTRASKRKKATTIASKKTARGPGRRSKAKKRRS